MRTQRILGVVLAGGEGKRLWPLTAERAKPAVPFGGSHRLVDFVLSNLVNGGVRRLFVLTQYKSHSLDRHLAACWSQPPTADQFVMAVPAQQRLGPRWYAGSADALFQSLNLVHDEEPEHVVVFGADHVYRMDPAQMIAQHIDSGADLTVATIRVPGAAAGEFGCVDADESGRIRGFAEKPADPPPVALASMGNYIFRTGALIDALRTNAAGPRHDIGADLVPLMVAGGRAYAYDFASNVVAGQSPRERGYWRDVGTLDAYYDAHRDLLAADPAFDLHNPCWPIRSGMSGSPARIVAGARAENSIVGPGAVLRGGSVRGCVLGAGVIVEDGAVVEDSVLLPGVRIGAGAVVRRAVIDTKVDVAGGVELGVDPVADAELYPTSANGVLVLGKGTRLT